MKGQAALEYLTTYGWALLALLGVIAALTYYGATDAAEALPSTCNFGTEFFCDSFIAAENGSFGFVLTNGQRTAINITGVKCISDRVEWLYSFAPAQFPVGNDAVFYCDANDAPQALSISGKDRFEATIYFNYDEEGALPRSQTGFVISNIVDETSTSLTSYATEAIN